MDANCEVMCFVTTVRPEAALAFYRDMLGLRLLADTPFALVFETSGRQLRVQKLAGDLVVPAGTALGWKVADLIAEVRALAAKGLVFNRYEGLGQDADGIWTTPDGSRVAWFCDPDGNTLSLTQFA